MLIRYLFITALMVPYLAFADEEINEEILVVTSRLESNTDNIYTLDVESSNQFSLVDQLRGMPGLSVSRAGNHGALTQIRIRGAEANHVMVIIDDVQATDPAQGSEFNFGTLTSVGVKKISIVKGPQSAVWGSDALAGVIHIDTRPTGSRREISVEQGQYRSQKYEMNLAKVSEAGFVSLDAGITKTDGSNVALSGNEKDGSEMHGYNLSARRVLGSWTLETGIRGTLSEVEIDPIPFPFYVPVDGNYSTHTNRHLGRMSANYLGPQWKSSLLISSNKSLVENIDKGQIATNTRGRRHTLTFSNNIHLSEYQDLNLTLDYERELLSQSGSVNLYGNPNQKQSIDTTSAVFEYDLKVAGYRLSFAGRHDSNSHFANTNTFRLGGDINIGPFLIAARAGTGVKNPTFFERFGFTPDTFYGNPTLEPETSKQIELSLHYNAFTISLFDADLKHEINGFVFDGARNTFTAKNENLKSTRTGVELDLSYALPNKTTFLNLAYTYLNAKQSGIAEIRRPRHSAHVELFHSFSFKLRGQLAIHYNGDQTDSDFSTYPATRRRLGHFTRISGSIHRQVGKRIELYARIENLLDTEYSELFGYRCMGLSAHAGFRLNLL